MHKTDKTASAFIKYLHIRPNQHNFSEKCKKKVSGIFSRFDNVFFDKILVENGQRKSAISLEWSFRSTRDPVQMKEDLKINSLKPFGARFEL